MRAVQDRTTKYTSAVREFIAVQRHATNAEILAHLQTVYPDISATTVHRITARLYERGELQLAPTGAAKVLRYDANLTLHDHFMCEVCGLLRDALLGDLVRPAIEQAIGADCSISGSLTVSGICKQCHKEGV